MKRIAAMLCLIAILLCGCGGGEETTLTGMVVSVDGTQVTLISMDTNRERSRTERPEGVQERPEGSAPALPEGEAVPQGGGFSSFGSTPEGESPTVPEGEMPTLPEGETMPEGTRPAMPEGGFGGRGQKGEDSDMEMETTTVDLADAHITVEFDGGKATGSMEDITKGSFLTITLINGKATNAVVTENSGFGGRGQGSFGGKGQGGNRRPDGNRTPDSTEASANT